MKSESFPSDGRIYKILTLVKGHSQTNVHSFLLIGQEGVENAHNIPIWG